MKTKLFFDQIAPKRALLDTHFLGNRDEDMVAFLTSLETLASTTKVSLEIETPSFVPLFVKPTNAGGVTSKDPVVLSKESQTLLDPAKWEVLKLQIRLDGSWQEILQYIALIESMPYSINFSQADITLVPDPAKKKTSWNGVFTLNVIKNK